MNSTYCDMCGGPQVQNHTCHWPGCDKQVPPAMWGCKPHWFSLPKSLRDAVWAAYVPGQEQRMDPSPEYLAVAYEVQEWIRVHNSTAEYLAAAREAGANKEGRDGDA